MSEVKINEDPQDESGAKVKVEEEVQSEEATVGDETVAEKDTLEEELGEVSVEQELAKAREQIAELQDKILRAAAENENYKKRMERERLASLRYAGEAILREMLPAVDNLERATQQGVVESADAEKNLTALLEGVQLTLKSLLSSLEKFEVKPLQTVGEPFDPKEQEALTMEASDTIPANHVVTEYEKGYYYKDRLLRAAKVVVSSGKADENQE